MIYFYRIKRVNRLSAYSSVLTLRKLTAKFILQAYGSDFLSYSKSYIYIYLSFQKPFYTLFGEKH